MESIIKGRMRDVDYPYVGNHFQQGRFVAKITVSSLASFGMWHGLFPNLWVTAVSLQEASGSKVAEF